MIDWEGMLVSTLYVAPCNFRCPFCYNIDLVMNSDQLNIIPLEHIISYLLERKALIDGICLSGGEPTLYEDLPDFLEEIKRFGFKIKLDTNGSFPERLNQIIKDKLIDFVAMDIKNSLNYEDYTQSIGISDSDIVDKIKKSIYIIKESDIDHEFRTTIVPKLHNFFSIEHIAQVIEGANKYVLQNFVNTEKTLDPSFQNIIPYNKEELEEIKNKVKNHVKVCCIR
mgnify:CR=1 FL=1